MKFSVIVPCYNVENYLDECVASILEQHYSDFELLLIDDGSKDRTGEKCDEWQLKDSRIRTFHKQNGGLSDARNYGIDRARGEYLIFIDSDDFIASKSFESIAAATESAPEVIITRLIEYFGECDIHVKDAHIASGLPQAPTKTEAVNWIMKETQNTWPAQKYIVSKEMVARRNLHFKKGVLHEDIDWTSRLVIAAERYGKCEYPWYYHRMKRKGSITNTIHAKSVIDILEMVDDLIFSETTPLQELPQELREKVADRIGSAVFVSINLNSKLNQQDKKIVKNAIAQHRNLLMLARKGRHKLFVMIVRVLGVSVALRLLDIFSFIT